jgi:hypothetical protein
MWSDIHPFVRELEEHVTGDQSGATKVPVIVFISDTQRTMF